MGVAKGGYQKRRIQQKKNEAKAARRRAARNKKIATWVVVGALLAAIGASTALVLTGSDNKTGAKSSPSASASASASPNACHTPDPSDLGKKSFAAAPCRIIDTKKRYTATMDTSMGTMQIRLFADKAPQTVNNFVFLAKQGFYDGSIFHRVIPDFGGPGSDMIQGGDAARRDGTGDPGYKFGDENMIPFDKGGYLAMANGGPGTNGSQFFLLNGKVGHLNKAGTCPGAQGCHSVFGEVVSGIEVIHKIAVAPQGASNKPVTDIVVKKVTITEA
jgi:cyclophilin family peptidyl-prolyl cis-trans isomerase